MKYCCPLIKVLLLIIVFISLSSNTTFAASPLHTAKFFIFKDINACSGVGNCTHMTLNQTQIDTAASTFLNGWTNYMNSSLNGKLTLTPQVVVVSNYTTINFGDGGGWGWIPPNVLQTIIGDQVDKNVDMVLATSPTPNPAYCGLSDTDAENLSAPYTYIFPGCVNGADAMIHESIHLIQGGLENVMKRSDMYDVYHNYNGGVYPQSLCGNTLPSNNYSWFPNIDSADKVPDFEACQSYYNNWNGYNDNYNNTNQSALHDGLNSGLYFYQGVLANHFPDLAHGVGNNYTGNHCRDGIRDYDETGADTGGDCLTDISNPLPLYIPPTTPPAPTSLAQYKSDGTTVISSGGLTNQTSVVLKFSMSSSGTTDTLTPQVEVEETGTPFNDLANDMGVDVDYSGTPVTGTATINWLTNGKTYHWQARTRNTAGYSNWVAMGGNSDFGVDTTTPVISLVSAITPTATGATITWNTNEDSSSKVDYGFTNAYGSSTAETDTSTRVTNHSVTLSSLATCTNYHYRVHSINAALNETIDIDNTFTTSGCEGSARVTAVNSAQITTAGGTLTLLDSNTYGITLIVPAAFANSDANFQVHQFSKDTILPTTSNPANYSLINNYIYHLQALDNSSATISTFNNPLTVTMSYAVGDTSGFDESTLKIYRWDGSVWTLLSGCVLDTLANTVSCTTQNFSVFGLFGQASANPEQNNNNNSNNLSSNSNSGSSCAGSSPSAPSIFQIWATKNTATIHFVPSQGAQNTYTVSYGPYSGAETYNTTFDYSDKRGAIPYTVNALNPGTVYYFKVRGNNGCMPGGWSNTLSLRTASSINNTSKAYSYNATLVKSNIPGGSCSEYTVLAGDSFWSIAQSC